jgi:hypothetical protein
MLRGAACGASTAFIVDVLRQRQPWAPKAWAYLGRREHRLPGEAHHLVLDE